MCKVHVSPTLAHKLFLSFFLSFYLKKTYMSLSSGGGFNISIAELPNISCDEGEYVPRVARAFLTLLMNHSDIINRAIMRRHIILVTMTKTMSTCDFSNSGSSQSIPLNPGSHSQ